MSRPLLSLWSPRASQSSVYHERGVRDLGFRPFNRPRHPFVLCSNVIALGSNTARSRETRHARSSNVLDYSNQHLCFLYYSSRHLCFLGFVAAGGSKAATIAYGPMLARASTMQEFPRFRLEMAYLVKYILQLVLRQGTTLDVLDRTQLLGHSLAVLFPHGLHLLLRQLVFDTGIISQIDLCANDEAGDTGAVMVDLGEPFLANVLEGCRRGDAETNEEDIGLRVGERSQSVVIFLTSSIEQAEGIRLITNPVCNAERVSAGSRGRRLGIGDWRKIVGASLVWGSEM